MGRNAFAPWEGERTEEYLKEGKQRRLAGAIWRIQANFLPPILGFAAF